MPQEQGELSVVERCDRLRDELLPRAAVPQTDFVEPGGDRVATTMGQVFGSSEVHLGPGSFGDDSALDPERLLSGTHHGVDVLRVGGRVLDGVTSEVAPVAEQVTEQHDLARRSHGLGSVAGSSERATASLVPGSSWSSRRHPSNDRNGWFPLAVTVPPGHESELEDRLRAAGEDVFHDAALELEVLVERPDRDVLLAGVEQCAERNVGAGVGPGHERVPGEAPGFAEIREHRALVGAVLQLAVQLRQRHHRACRARGRGSSGRGRSRRPRPGGSRPGAASSSAGGSR